MSEWQTIETAPKDGREIIAVFCDDYGYQEKPTIHGPWTVRWKVGEWQSSWGEEQVIEYQGDFGVNYKSPDVDPTHWMPLPSPPK